jgi:hypothetical protein
MMILYVEASAGIAKKTEPDAEDIAPRRQMLLRPRRAPPA